jgi:hypothetical protein
MSPPELGLRAEALMVVRRVRRIGRVVAKCMVDGF